MCKQPYCRNILATLLLAGMFIPRLNAQLYYSDYPYIKMTPASSGGMFQPEKLSIIIDRSSKIISWNDFRTEDMAKPATNGAGAVPVYSLWVEKGDGNYLSSMPENPENLSYNSQLYPAVMYATKIYEHDRRPPTGPSATARSATNMRNNTPLPAGADNDIKSPALGRDKMIALFSNVREVVPGDPMVFGISYKASSVADEGPVRYRIVFRYNSSDSIAFKPITTETQFSELKSGQAGSEELVKVDDIRIYNNEKTFLVTPQSAYEQARLLVTTTNGTEKKFQNGIVFDEIPVDDRNWNIFISLTSEEEKVLPFNIDFEAELYYKKERGEWVPVGKGLLNHLNKAEAHDPNSISVSPAFLTLPQQTQTLHYDIDFQNTGMGNAEAVTVIFNCPPKMNWQKKIWNVKASYSEKTTYVIDRTDYDVSNGKIVFTINPVVAAGRPQILLDGTQGLADPLNNPLTKGHISFDLEVMPDVNRGKQETLPAWADIYFRGQFPSDEAIKPDMVTKGIFPQGTETYELPVRTMDASATYTPACAQPAPCTGCAVPKKFFPRLGYAIRTIFGDPCRKSQPAKPEPKEK